MSKKFPFVLSVLLGLSACAPPQSHYTKRGEPCHPVGYSWNPYWVGPDDKTWCSAQ
jgi:hypothetical protein